jgi:hypothetical protein
MLSSLLAFDSQEWLVGGIALALVGWASDLAIQHMVAMN